MKTAVARSAERASEIAPEPLVTLMNVTKTYEVGGAPVEVLRGVSLEIAEGEFVAIMGPSGSGKTTLMNLIGCLDRPTAGTYLLNGEDVSQFDSDRLALVRRSTFGFVFQRYNLLATATATENVELPALYAGTVRASRRERAVGLLERLGLADRLDYRPTKLSGGQQQRVAIARALMNGGRMILADEPTGALDTKTGAELMAVLHELHRHGHTIVIITHDAKVASEAERIIEIQDGRIISPPRRAAGAPQLRSMHPHDGAAVSVESTPIAHPIATATVPPISEAVRSALRSLRVNRFRTFLTMLGIIIGVASVIAMLAFGNGAKQQVLAQIEAMGTNLLIVRPGAPGVRGVGATTATLTPEDAMALAELPNVRLAVPEITGPVTLRYGNKDVLTSADGTTPEFPTAKTWPAVAGSFFASSDVDGYTPVVVLGVTVKEALFSPSANAVGEYVMVGNVPFQVVGVMASKGADTGGNDQDNVVWVPITTARARIFGRQSLRFISVVVDDQTNMGAVQQSIQSLLLARHNVEDFSVRNLAALMETASATQNTLTLLLAAIAAISLLVGGIGVMNIMLVSVTERTREIGIRMAVGARRTDVLVQFLVEGLVTSGIGGLIGIVVGVGAAAIASRSGSPVVYSLPPILIAFASAFAVGVVFGYMPARRAANLDPVVALSTE